MAFSGTLNKFTYRTAFNQHFSDGLSAAISDINEKDTFSKQGVDINFGYSFNEAFSLNIFGILQKRIQKLTVLILILTWLIQPMNLTATNLV